MGRRLTINNPDTGLTTYTYDANGNVTTKETANLKTGAKKIGYNYEYNRLVKIDYPDSVDVQYEYGASTEAGDANGNLAGRIKQVTDESGTEQRWYGKLGETVKELRQVNAYNNPVARTKYETRYVFDSFGRMQQLTYPDGEVLTYGYDNGGLLKEAYGTKRGNKYVYIKDLAYDEYGQRTAITYGNGVKTTYTYDEKTRRLERLYTVALGNKGSRVIQDIDYQYDLVGNIMYTDNTGAPIPGGGEQGGPARQDFTYDDLYQLTTANGWHQAADNKKTTYANSFTYDIIGNITRKFQQHKVVHSTDSATEPRETNYDMTYLYNGTQPHAVTDTKDFATSAPVKNYTYDTNGNMTGWTSQTSGQNRTIVWNEENRVKSIADSGSTTDFLYNDAGERAVKRGQHGESVYINRFYAVKNGDLGSKHIFAGETRVVTKLEKDGGSIQSGVPGSTALIVSQGIQKAILQGNGTKKGINRRLTPSDGSGGTTTTTNPPIEKFEFFYHGDHLGSSSFITDDAGAVYQHLEYFPYGETWVEEGGSGQMPYYRFTGKELDPETGLYYYGARYYDPVLSRWISADPILEKYLPSGNKKRDANLPAFGGVFAPQNLSLYAYSHHNPVILLDPDGNEVNIKVTSTVTGYATARTLPRREGGGEQIEVHTYKVKVLHKETGIKWSFNFTRDATRGGVLSVGEYGKNKEAPPGNYKGVVKYSDSLDAMVVQIYDPRIQQNPVADGKVTNPEDPDTPRQWLLFHKLGCSEGCLMSSDADQFVNLIQLLNIYDKAVGNNPDININIQDRSGLWPRLKAAMFDAREESKKEGSLDHLWNEYLGP